MNPYMTSDNFDVFRKPVHGYWDKQTVISILAVAKDFDVDVETGVFRVSGGEFSYELTLYTESEDLSKFWAAVRAHSESVEGES